jgi:hypothetical protein
LPPWNAPNAEDTCVPAKRNECMWTKKQTHIFSPHQKELLVRKTIHGAGPFLG